MSATTRIVRLLLAGGAAGALVLSTAGCSSAVPKADVASQITQKFTAQGVPIDNGTVACGEDLPAEVGATITCEFASDGQPVGAVVKVSGVKDDMAQFDITTEARAIPSALLADKVDRVVTDQLGIAVETASCSDDLAPNAGATAPCRITTADEYMDVVATVTGVDGGQVDFTIDDAPTAP